MKEYFTYLFVAFALVAGIVLIFDGAANIVVRYASTTSAEEHFLAPTFAPTSTNATTPTFTPPTPWLTSVEVLQRDDVYNQGKTWWVGVCPSELPPGTKIMLSGPEGGVVTCGTEAEATYNVAFATATSQEGRIWNTIISVP